MVLLMLMLMMRDDDFFCLLGDCTRSTNGTHRADSPTYLVHPLVSLYLVSFAQQVKVPYYTPLPVAFQNLLI